MSSRAAAAMLDAAQSWANPSSVHAEGRRARGRLESLRESVAESLGTNPAELVFTSGGTEALALAIGGTKPARQFILGTEHAAVLAAATNPAIIPVDSDGLIDLAWLEASLGEGALVAVQHANNETGVVQPIEAVFALTRARGARLLVDAVQTAGKVSLPVADMVAISAHKLGGPPGVGALVVRYAASLHAVQKGGGQERGLRGGTENLPGIAGFAAAIAERVEDTGWMVRIGEYRDRMETALIAAGAEIYGAAAPRLPTTSMIRMPGVPAATQLIHFDMAGIAVSSGAACSSGKVGSSHVLAAMRAAGADEAVRVSFGWNSTAADAEAFSRAWQALASRRRAA